MVDRTTDPPTDALDELARLGRLTPDEIAADLHGRGVRGWRRRCYDCPLSHHLTAADGAEVIVASGDDGLEAFDSFRSPPMPLPPSVARFVRRFDAGHYPELDASRHA